MSSLERIVALLPWCPSVRLSVCLPVTSVHCNHTVHFSADLSLWFDSPMFWTPWHQSMPTYSQPSFSSSTWKTGGVWMCKLGEELNANDLSCRQTHRLRIRILWILNKNSWNSQILMNFEKQSSSSKLRRYVRNSTCTKMHAQLSRV